MQYRQTEYKQTLKIAWNNVICSRLQTGNVPDHPLSVHILLEQPNSLYSSLQ